MTRYVYTVLVGCFCMALAAQAATPAARSGSAAPAPARGPAWEPSDWSGIAISAKLGTLGPGADLTVGVNQYLGTRFQANGGSWEPTIENDDGTIQADFEWLTYGALLDWFPAGGGFRITTGLYLNKNKAKMDADLTESVTLGGEEYYLDELEGSIKFADTAPYLGIGYGNAVAPDSRWHFSCDFGVLFQGAPEITASARASDPALQPAVDAALEREVADLEDDASILRFYPVIAVGVSFQF